MLPLQLMMNAVLFTARRARCRRRVTKGAERRAAFVAQPRCGPRRRYSATPPYLRRMRDA